MMIDNDFPAVMGGNSSAFLKGYMANRFGGRVNDTQLPTTGEYADYEQTMRNGQASPLNVNYGTFGTPGQTPYSVAASPFDPKFVVPGQTPNSGRQPIMPGENRKKIDDVYRNRIKGDALNIGPGFTGLQLPPA